ncbi:MAG: RidA family protein [Clostridia bacterium]|nr:RidA family protein [Clostridia bacterium]
MGIPELLIANDGKRVTTQEEWAARRKELLDVLSSEEYGFLPPKEPACLKLVSKNKDHYGGRGVEEKLELTIKADKGDYTLPLTLLHPDAPGRHPLFLYISFSPELYQKSLPAEVLLKRGYSVALIHYAAVTSDDNDFTNGLAGLMDRPCDGTGWGKLSLWAWTLSRALDEIIKRDDVDVEAIAVIGHSRLGKTALWCGANDERIRFTCVNDSGCSGAAMERGKNPASENAEIICRRFPFWFCENYKKHGTDVEHMPFDQHFAIAACCPRYVAVTSASLDEWADPPSEKRSCEAASCAWQLFGRKGFGDDAVHFLREGTHFLSLDDWEFFMDFIDRHKGERSSMKTASIAGAKPNIGPYSSATITGNLVYTSGQLGADPISGEMPSDVKGQAEQAFKNVAALLCAAGSDISRVVKTTVFIKNMDDFKAVNEVYACFFTEPYPARSCVEVARLPKDALVECEAIAEL